MEKQRAHIENWYRLGGYLKTGGTLVGNITDHPRQHEFTENKLQRTSTIVWFDEANGTCETRNTIYTLGKKANDIRPTGEQQ